MPDWNPAQYERFKAERALPFHDLLALVEPGQDMRAVDLGCGTGEATAVLHKRLGCQETLGVDRSAAMLARSAAFAAPGLSFVQADMVDWHPPAPLDLVFSNAALHWLPEHPLLLAKLHGWLARGGQLAVQVPANHDHASHTVAWELAEQPPFAAALGGWRGGSPVLKPEAYSQLLFDLGFERQHLRLQVYSHVLPSSSDVVEWVKGSLLTDIEARLSPEMFAKYLARYRQVLLERLGERRPYQFAFKRILMWGRLPT